MPAAPSSLRAFLVAGGGIMVYTVMDAMMKQLSIDSGAYNAVLWRSIGGAILCGVLVIAAGELQADASTQAVLGSLACVAASVLYAGSLILLRRQAQVADPVEVAFFANLVIGTMLLPAAPWLGAVPAWAQLLPLSGAILLNIASVMALAWAYARAEAQVLAPVEYSAFVWAALAGWIAFGETVSPYTVVGALLIVAGCVVAVRRRVPAVQSEAGA